MPFLEIKVPVRLISEANNLDHWTKKHRRKKKIRDMLDSYWPHNKDIKLPCTIELIRVSPRKLDFDNLVNSMKGVRDFAADKLIPGLAPGRADDDDRLEFIYSQEKGKPREYALIIKITPSISQ